MFYVYALKNKAAKIYIGRSRNLQRRIREHKRGKAWTTKRMGAVELVFYEAFKCEKDAIRREKYFKTSKGRASLRQIVRTSIL